MRSTLRSPRLRRILAAYTINRMGTWFGLLALVVAVYDHTHSALAVSALLFAGQALPAFAVPAVVARVEASRRRSELTALFAFEALATAALALLVTRFSLAPVLVLVSLDGTAALAASALVRSEVARAAREEAVARRTPVEEPHRSGGATTPPETPAGEEERRHEVERNANAALTIAFSATFVLGPVLGGALVAATGAPTALLIDVASFLACGLLLLDLHPHVEDAAGDSVRARLRSALNHINQAPALRGLLIVEAIALVFIETGAPIEVPFVKGTLHAGDGGLGLVLTMWGAGAVLGSVVFARLTRRPLGHLLGAGTALIGAAYLALSIAGTLLVACLAALLGGVGNSLQWPSLVSLVQRQSPAHLHGRMMGAVESLGALCLAAGLSLGGLLVAATSPRSAFVVVGVGAVVSTLALVRMTRETPDAAPVFLQDAGETADQRPHAIRVESAAEVRPTVLPER